MTKKVIYAEIPEFDETTQYVVQLPPVESEDEIFYGVEIRIQAPSNDSNCIPEPSEWMPYIPPAPTPSDSERMEALEAAMLDLILGGSV